MAQQLQSIFAEAIRNGDQATLEELLEKFTQSYCILKNDVIARIFNEAIKIKNEEIIKILTERFQSDCVMITKLTLEHDLDQLVQWFFESDASVKDKVLKEKFLLDTCVKYDSLKCLNYFVDQGADVQQVTVTGETLLHLACDGASIKVVKFLCELNKFEINRADAFNRNAFHIACQCSKNIEIVKFLLDTTIDKNLLDTYGSTPFTIACLYRADNIVSHLLSVTDKYNIKIDESNKNYQNYKKRQNYRTHTKQGPTKDLKK